MHQQVELANLKVSEIEARDLNLKSHHQAVVKAMEEKHEYQKSETFKLEEELLTMREQM